MTGNAGESLEGRCSHWVRPVYDGLWHFNLQVQLLILVFMNQRMQEKQWINTQDSHIYLLIILNLLVMKDPFETPGGI